jgi:hypothetical protein
MTRAVPSIPLYTTCPEAFGAAAFARNAPCACSFVFITSSGQDTTPDAKPPTAPAIVLNDASDLPIANRSIAVIGPFRSLMKPDGVRANCDVGAWAYSVELRDGGVLRSCDIVYLARVRLNYTFDESRASADRSSGFVVVLANIVSRCAGKFPTQHASDTAASDYHRPLTIAKK